MEQLSRGDGLGLNVLPNGDVVNENGDFIKKDGVYLDSPPFNNEIIPMEGIDQSFYNGSFITEEEAADEVFIKSMETQFKSEPEVDDFDVSGNKEPTLGENIAEFGSKLKDKLNENEAFVDNIKKDTAIGAIQGADAGLKNTLYAPGDIIGAGVDFVNDKIVKPVLNEFGIEGSDRPFMGTEMNTEAMDKITSFINDITPNFLKEPINEFADQPFTFETYGNLVKGFSQFGIVAIPAAQIVGYMSSANSLVRAVAWSGISDFTAMNPDDPAIAKVLLDYFEVNQDKLEPWATNAIAVLEKHDTDGRITKRLKNFQEGVIVGAFADTVLPLIRGILKGSVNIPWKGLTPLIAGTAATTNSNEADASLFGAAVKAAAKEVVPNAIAKNADNTIQVDNLSDGIISARLPTAKNSTEDGIQNNLQIGSADILNDTKSLDQNITIVKDYPNLKNDEINGSSEEVAETYIEHMRNNLLWLHDKVPENTKVRSKLWYEGANKVVNELAKEYNLPANSIAGVFASLSPQKDWFMNADLGKRVLSILSTKQDVPFSEKMLDVAINGYVKNGKKIKGIFSKPKFSELLNYIKNKKLSELETSAEKAMWLRLYDESHNNPTYKTLTPEGNFTNDVLNDDGSASSIAWNSNGMIEKAIDSFYSGGDSKVISPLMGSRHKVRSFFNNIIDPKSLDGSVTIDTHAVAASTLRPVSGNSTIVHHNFGTSPEIKKRLPDWNGAVTNSSVTGVKGLYGLYAEAYRRAALDRGILPREMQSITWEAIRGLYTKGFKQSRQNVEYIDSLWYKYRNGNLTLDEVKNGIEQRTNGIDAPSWE